MQSSGHPEVLAIGDHTLTYESFRGQDREGRRRLREELLARVQAELDGIEELRQSIDREVKGQFASQYEGIPRNLPGRLTKSGQPDRRYGTRTNPAWSAVNRRETQTLVALLDRVPALRGTFRWPYQFENALFHWEITAETPAERFERLLASTDWYSAQSDDYSVWAAGERRMRELQELIGQLGPEAQRAFNRACPWLDEDGKRREAA
jgi:hypothetical protein